MKKKIFVISIPMLPLESLKPLRYRFSETELSGQTHFPGIAMLEKYASGKAPVKIVTVKTDADNNRTGDCYRLFLKELSELSEQTGISLTIDKEISLPHNESENKSRYLLRELLDAYEKSGYVYLDLTYGTKLTAIELFSSLCYAEIYQKCSIKSIIYGKYSFDGLEEGELYDITKTYHMLRFLETAAHMDRNSFGDLIKQLLEES